MDHEQACYALRNALAMFLDAQTKGATRDVIDALGEEVRRLCGILDALDKQGGSK